MVTESLTDCSALSLAAEESLRMQAQCISPTTGAEPQPDNSDSDEPSRLPPLPELRQDVVRLREEFTALRDAAASHVAVLQEGAPGDGVRKDLKLPAADYDVLSLSTSEDAVSEIMRLRSAMHELRSALLSHMEHLQSSVST